MSDTPQGEGWWLASDGKWYPPQVDPRPPPPVGGWQPTAQAPTPALPADASWYRRAWARFRSWPMLGQVFSWVGLGFVVLLVVGAIAGPPEEEASDQAAAIVTTTTEPAAATTEPAETTTTTATTEPPTTTTEPAPTTTARPRREELSFDSRLDDDTGVQDAGYEVCKQFIERRLRSPGSASYPDFYEDDGEVVVFHMADGDYRYTSHVDSENGFGALLRSFFVCRVDYVGDDRWRLQSLSLG